MLTGKVCIVTGGGHGLGEATALELGRQGAAVVVNDLGTTVEGEGESEEPARETAAAVRAEGGTATAHFGDVASLEYTQKLIDDTVSEYGRIDAVANFAGIMIDAPLPEMTGDDWDDVVRVHLRGHFSLLRNLAAHWHRRKETDGLSAQRSFVSLSSRSAHNDTNRPNYSAAKAGILGLTRTAARELYDDVRVNALIPSGYTRIVERAFEHQEPFFEPEDMPPERTAAMVAFLVSDNAVDITGCTIRISNEMMGIVSDPELQHVAFRDGGWTTESITERFRDAFGDDDQLTKLDAGFDR